MILIKQHLDKLSCGYRGYTGEGGQLGYTDIISLSTLSIICLFE